MLLLEAEVLVAQMAAVEVVVRIVHRLLENQAVELTPLNQQLPLTLEPQLRLQLVAVEAPPPFTLLVP
jgi:hypothetical protein